MASPTSLAHIERMQTIQQQIRLLEAERADVIADMDRDDTATDTGHNELSSLVSEALHIDVAKASRIVANAHLVAEELTPTGHTTPAPLPTMRKALREGLVDNEHIQAVGEVMKALPDWVSTQDRELVETTLGETARTERPMVVRKHGQILLERLNQDGVEPKQEEKLAEPANAFWYTRLPNGRMKFRGNLERETAETFEGLLTQFSKPESPAPGVDDPRTGEQRLGDAMADIVDLAANPSSQGGQNQPRMIVTLDLSTLLPELVHSCTDKVAVATLESGTTLCASAARRLACDAELIPMVLGGASVPLDRGRATRFVTEAQRDALIVRDKGCAMPGCGRPARICDAHHVLDWRHGGPTDLRNLVLLCRRHHRQLHHGEWRITVQGDLPYFIPPKWVDPLQRPMRNIMRT